MQSKDLLISSDSECVDATLDYARLKQGDIFRWLPPHDVSPWKVTSIVVTADCDIVKNKNHGVITYVPVLKCEEYITLFWALKFSEERVAVLKNSVLSEIETIRSLHLPDTDKFSEDAVISWCIRSKTSDIIGTFPGIGKNISERATNKIDTYRSSLALLQNLKENTTIDNLILFTQTAYSDSPQDRLSTEFKNHTKSLPGDVFYIDKIPGIEGRGFFVLLRHIQQCSDQQLSLNTEDTSGQARRLASLRSPYLYFMTQALGKVFSDIGLPSDHQSNRDSLPSHFFKKMGK